MNFKDEFKTPETLTEAKDRNIEEIGKLVPTTDFFGLGAVLKKARFKTDYYGYKALKATKGGKSYMISSVDNLENPDEAELIVGKMAIGFWE